ncbi:putative protein [BD1-7 clade bacterium]|uniref:Transglutaminase-like domain-containing protein n=1 Tax=BD1-7 clade bacterium TaxID=2029982 RepID=A0A5S9N343_9GAMM|nr:putative protein [BD1-7 clade bacterium]CAA0083446.1 putative protein [BD1-7 clade bacterium]
MTIRVAIRHKTHYRFDHPVALHPHVIRLRPAPHCRTRIHAYSLKISPSKHFINWQQDPFGNYLARLVFLEKSTALDVEVEVITDMDSINPFDFFLDEYANHMPFSYPAALQKQLLPYLELLPETPKVMAYLDTLRSRFITNKPDTNDCLVNINQQLHGDVDYLVRMEVGVQSPEETLTKGSGSCRDSAWLFVQLLRRLGMAARFVSGYLVQLKQDMKALDGPSGADADFTDLHAWAEVFLPGAGWVGLDPTSGLFASEGHIPLACTPDPQAASPIEGSTDTCEVEFSFTNTVARVHEDPRVTKPYSEDQWQTIQALGTALDQQLKADDVRLTMGGEPTFVSIDDMESAQWNTEALGDDKLKRAKDLLIRLQAQFAPHGLLHYGQGKWYPGEPLPRWALGLYWRKDDIPLWKNPTWLARIDQNARLSVSDAKRFIDHLAKTLHVDNAACQPTFEDALYHLREQQQIPANIEAALYQPTDDNARAALAAALQQSFDVPAGYILPLAGNELGGHWKTSLWPMRRGRIILTPGDSPLGLRLPLEALPYRSDDEQKLDPPISADPFAPHTPLRKHLAISAVETSHASSNTNATEQHLLNDDVIRTALCAEVREGNLYIFVPPLPHLDEYLALINAVETTAASLQMPVIVEGYAPPKDARLNKLLITPDPGVIEVNIHPSDSWAMLEDTTETLYEEARKARLATEKFMLDGRHTGTGGGNHITLGGPTPADSPLLRRPDLIQSLVTFWQHHPSLSYLFSGAFIGPTSQAPRVDEGRDETLYELEIAFSQIELGTEHPPWFVDRVLRNLLIDITGNTHRAEFCIDKLYNPTGPAGRQGILEFRGFEMPPHSRMALVQALLLRALVLRFWKHPYRHRLVRWGTRLHDEFMLPHYIWADIKEVVEDLNLHDIPFDVDWLRPFEEFRFPHYGCLQLGDINLELRWAIEPWHVLGEEVSNFGTSRYVDSSLERLQVRVTGIHDDRYILCCNGRRLPLRATGRQGEWVAGVRYRAWQPPSALHPLLEKDIPLVFDVIDSWNGQCIGGCTYHVSHPGGLSYDHFPVNAFEAQSRRGNRFDTLSHTQGVISPSRPMQALRTFFPHQQTPKPMAPPAEEASAEYPHTLDLRRLAQAPFSH